MLSQAQKTIKEFNLLPKNRVILAGVSGGPDSLALLYLLYSLRKDYSLKLYVAHLDHMLRKDSSKDSEFVEGIARKLKLPFFCGKVNLKKLAKKGSLEEAARNARLEFLFKAAKKVKAGAIALGHNLDDQAETVLMRILRGTGLYGLSAILPKRNIRGYEIIRPLIRVRRREIETYLKKKRIIPRRDPSNKEDIYFRNKIRNRLIPLLEREYSGNIRELLSNLAESAGQDYDYLANQADRYRRFHPAKINLTAFRRVHPSIQRIILRKAIARLKGDTRRITFKHIKEIEGLIASRPVNSVVDLPKGISVVKQKKGLRFFRR